MRSKFFVWSAVGAFVFTALSASAAPATPAASASTTITGSVTSISPTMMTVKVPEHGPGLNHGPGIHAMFIVAARIYMVDITKAQFRKPDGSATTRAHVVVGDQVSFAATPAQNNTYRASVVTDTPQKAPGH